MGDLGTAALTRTGPAAAEQAPGTHATATPIGQAPIVAGAIKLAVLGVGLLAGYYLGRGRYARGASAAAGAISLWFARDKLTEVITQTLRGKATT